MPTTGLHVRYYGLARNAVGRAEESLCLPPGSTVRQLIDRLVEQHGDSFRHSVVTGDGRLRATAQILVGARNIAELDGLATILDDAAAVTIMVIVYPVEGG